MYDGARRTRYDWGALEIFNVVSAVAFETRYLSVVFDADDELAASSICECAYMFGDFFVILAGAFAVKVLVFFRYGMLAIAASLVLMFSGCVQSGASSESDDVASNDSAASEQMAKPQQGDVAVFLSPYYTISLPEEYAAAVDVRTDYDEYCLNPKESWGDKGPWSGFNTSILNSDGYADFFVYAAMEQSNGSVAGPQGTFLTRDVGTVGPQKWHILVCKSMNKGNPSAPDYDRGAEEAQLDVYASYVEASYQPERVEGSDFLQFLNTNCGKEWASDAENEEMCLEKISDVLEGNNWVYLSDAIKNGEVRESNDSSNIDFAGISFDGMSAVMSPAFSVGSISGKAYYPSRFLYSVKGWKQVSADGLYGEEWKCRIELTVAISQDGGSSWRKDQWYLQVPPPDSHVFEGRLGSALSKEGSLSLCLRNYVTFEPGDFEVDLRAAEQEELRNEAQTLLLKAIASDDYSPKKEGVDLLSPLDGSSEIAWVMPGYFENYAFDKTGGYYVKIWASQAVDGQSKTNDIPTKDEWYCIYEVYDNGNGSTIAKPIDTLDGMPL